MIPVNGTDAKPSIAEMPSNLSLRSVLAKKTDMRMIRERNRLASFANWPFQEDSACTPLKMAQAGFYYCPADNEPDLARCYVCFKELAGWEPHDDPAVEHSRAVDCAFVKLGKVEADMTFREVMVLEKQRIRNRLAKLVDLTGASEVESVRKVERAVVAARRRKL